MSKEKIFNKYRDRGSIHWREMMSRDIRKFNAFQQARYEWISRFAGDLQDKKVLDLGCGDGALSYLLAERGAHVIGVDNEELGITYARQNVPQAEFVLASAYELPFPEASFDIVTNCEVIEHLQEPEKMLKEVYRVLRPAGRLILMTPHRLTERSGDNNHVREYFPGEIKSMLEMTFPKSEIRLTHHVFWYGLYTYSFRRFNNRQFGKWFVNLLTLWFGWNPFMIDYPKPTKRDVFTEIIAAAYKK